MLFGKPESQIIKHPGIFKAAAERAGMTTAEYAQKVLSDPKASETEKKRARLAQTFARWRHS